MKWVSSSKHINVIWVPYAAIEGEHQGEIVDLIDRRAEPSRCRQLDQLAAPGPDRIRAGVASVFGGGERGGAAQPGQPLLPHLVMPAHHEVRAADVNITRLHATLARGGGCRPKDFAELR